MESQKRANIIIFTALACITGVFLLPPIALPDCSPCCLCLLPLCRPSCALALSGGTEGQGAWQLAAGSWARAGGGRSNRVGGLEADSPGPQSQVAVRRVLVVPCTDVLVVPWR